MKSHSSKVKKTTDAEFLYNKIIRNQYCIGCGLCASLKDSPFKMVWNKYGMLEPFPIKDLKSNSEVFSSICPFSGYSLDEDRISEIFFPEVTNRNFEIGKSIKCYAGYVNEEPFRRIGTSGGFSKWIAYNLLINRITTHHIHVVPELRRNSDALFHYRIITDPEEILSENIKSAYYPVSLHEIIQYVDNNDGKYSITALPCFSKALRLYSLRNPIFKTRIMFIIGIICGSLKTANYAKSIAWQMGIRPDELQHIDFRVKMENYNASVQGNLVCSKSQIKRIKTNRELFGLDYGMGFFKPNACDYCDDIVAETADISFGDAWLQEYKMDYKGTSVIVVRNQFLYELLEEAKNKSKIFLEAISHSQIVESQVGSFRHRREGLFFRINEKNKKNIWTPKTRVNINNCKEILPQRKRVYHIRQLISSKSHKAFLAALEKDDINIYYKKMTPLIEQYNSKRLYNSFIFTIYYNIRSFMKRIRVFKLMRNIYMKIK